MCDYLVSNYNIEDIQFSKLKKHGEYMVCKVKYSGNDFFIQFPKMKLVSDFSKNIELEFSNNSKYNKEVYNFLSILDEHISNYIFKMSEDWFGKKIPIENIKKMYNNFIKAPKTTNDNCTMNFVLKSEKGKIDCDLLDNKNNQLDPTDFTIGTEIECIAQLKYILFSKDNCFTVWELCTAKLNKRINRVKQYGFIEVEESDSDNEETFTFFN